MYVNCDVSLIILIHITNIKMLSQPSPRLYIGDSWFGSVRAAEAVALAGEHAIFIVKTAFSRSPKKWLDKEMKDYPGGTWIVLKGTTKKDVYLVSLGYKYNSRTVLTFVMTEGAGSTESGTPYQTRFPDVYGNLYLRDVPRPAVLNRFFEHCGKVDASNQTRQGFLALEDCWVTTNPYFRLWTTIVGQTVTDLHQLHKRFNRYHNRYSVRRFADRLAYGLIAKAQEIENEDAQAHIAEIEEEEKKLEYEFAQSDLPEIIQPRGIHSESQSRPGVYDKFHTRAYLPSSSNERIDARPPQLQQRGRQVRCVWCSRVNGLTKYTKLVCVECGTGFCNNETTGRKCWVLHVRNNGAPCRGKSRK